MKGLFYYQRGGDLQAENHCSTVNDDSHYTYLRIRATFILQIKNNEEVVIGRSFAPVEKHSEVDIASAVFTVFLKLNGPLFSLFLPISGYDVANYYF